MRTDAERMTSASLERCHGGVVPPICTPLSPGGEVDIDSLIRLRRRLLDAGVSGIFALGSTGEASYLTQARRRRVVDVLAAEKGPEALLVGIVDTSTARVLDAVDDLIGGLDQHGGARVDAIVATAPFYANVSQREVLRHFEALAARSPVPVLAYNIPSNVGYALTAGVMQQLLIEGTVIGIKDSSPDLASFRQVTAAVAGVRPRPLLFTGSDALLDCALDAGADGAVPGLAHVAPELFVQALAAHRREDRAQLRELIRRIGILVRLYQAIDLDSGPNAIGVGAIKTALVLQGVIDGDPLSEPMTPVSPDRRGYVRSVLADVGLLSPASL